MTLSWQFYKSSPCLIDSKRNWIPKELSEQLAKVMRVNLKNLGGKISDKGVVTISSESSRSQEANKQEALEKLYRLIVEHAPKEKIVNADQTKIVKNQ